MVLKAMELGLPDSFEASYAEAEPLDYYLEASEVRFGLEGRQWANLLATPADHHIPVTLRTPLGLVSSRLKLTPAQRSAAPIIFCHHGLGQRPFDFVGRYFVRPILTGEAHIISLQAPFHWRMRDPIQTGFSSLAHLHQMLAGSVVIMEALRQALPPAPLLTVGLSLGGIITLLHQGYYGGAAAVVPVCASPDMAQVLLDQAARFGRTLTIDPAELRARLDFSELCLLPEDDSIFPVLAEADLFFGYEHHRGVYGDRPVLTLPNHSHISGPRDRARIQRHIRTLFDALPESGQNGAPALKFTTKAV